MLTFYIAAATLLALACTRAPLRRLATIRIRQAWLLWAALADQVLIISVIPNAHPAVLAAAHLASYIAGGACLLINRRLPGVWLVGVGGALNALAIGANGGTMPASELALRASGWHTSTEHFNNSAPLSSPRLPLLGDIFATPPWLPGHTVFSVGDIAIWLGIALFLWRTCRPRPGQAMTATDSSASTAMPSPNGQPV
jgi:hypothetical protein